MDIHGLLTLIAQTPEFRALANGTGLENGAHAAGDPPGPQSGPRLSGSPRSAELFVSGLSGAHKSLYLAAMGQSRWLANGWAGSYHDNGADSGAHAGAGASPLTVPARRGPFSTILAVTYSPAQAERLYDDLSSLLPADDVALFPARETWPHEEASRNLDMARGRLGVMERLARGEPLLVITPVQAAAEKLMPLALFRQLLRRIDLDSRIDPARLGADLVAMGYERVDMVEAPGQFSVRGGLIDVFPMTGDAPARIELFDDEVDSLRTFDPATQRSLDRVERVHIPPAREFLVPDGIALDAILAEAERQAGALRRIGKEAEAGLLAERVHEHLQHLASGRSFPGAEQYKPFVYDRLDTLFDYARPALVVLDEPVRLKEQLHLLAQDFAESHSNLLERGLVLRREAEIYVDWHELFSACKRHPLAYFAALDKRIPGMETAHHMQVESRSPELFHGKLELFAEAVRRWQRDRNRVCIMASTSERAQRVAEILRDEDVPAVFVPRVGDELRAGNVVVTTGSLQGGVVLAHAKLVILTDLEVFGQRKQRRRAKAPESGARIRSFADLKEGDYVVHVNHGIGRYLGVETLEINRVHKDYLVIQYAGEDKLYVPTEQVDLLQKYIGFDGQPPRLYKLGGNEWARVKRRVKESVQEMAASLLKLYAERETAPGYAFSLDTVWQQQFEDAFPYEETPDQLRAIQEVKAALERPRPMDRLLCGDVGYGKTEVAIRAAFKCVMDSKQVAVLVPTTILAQQHHRTFVDRFEGYPVRIEVLSRFQSPAEQHAVLAGLEAGTVDVVIGTHRLLSKDVRFKDLGLVVVDEEQRFGVAQKERLKELRKSVDVLTLTATPIPRTLHMALVGVRDMSIIETPPEDRYPIRTYVVEYNDELVREAILRELARDGQVYFVHNRVQSIDHMASHLMKLVPEARIAVAHGQMDEEKLERVMLDFLQGEYDVLLCSTIIETGMDIANVNTLVVYDADRMGLAQLYQLRGRVGRSNRVAYAYFTYRKDKILTEDAEKRLQAIKEFTELGSGFKIAMRDLEIRGAGNILGPEQHGFIASVGFELYCKLLEESVRELKGEVVHQPPDPVIDLHVDAYISDQYVPDSQQKVEIYKKILGIRRLEQAQDLADEIGDRFGAIPLPVQNLLAVARIKVLAREVAVASIGLERGDVGVRFLSGVSLPRECALHLTRRYRNRLSVTSGRTATMRLRTRGMSEREMLGLIEEALREIRSTWPANGRA